MPHPFLRSLSRSAAAVFALAGALFAQANLDPAIDIKLGGMGNLTAVNRIGTFPDGVNAAAMSTTVCNQGAPVNWFKAMNPDHPFIAFLIARESNGRFEQISDRSYVKHGFFALTSSQCTPCQPPGGQPGTFLGVGCSDTYDVSNNSDNYWLGPPAEIDPWLGAWDPVCSHFDLGVPPAATCDGSRSFGQNQASGLGPIGNRIHLNDQDLLVPGAQYWYQAQYVIGREPEAVREDDLGSRGFTPLWEGTTWNLKDTPPLHLPGSILQRWSGASLASASNGPDDGRVYVAVKVSGPVDGLWHYELAFHNRDNFRGVGAVRIPLCPSARILNAGFRDVDQDGGNDWSAAVAQAGDALVFTDTSGTNALRWNTIYNAWFDSDAAPLQTTLGLVQADPGAGLGELSVPCPAPLELFNEFAGAGCSLDGTPPTLFATGSPARATLGNASFGLVSAGNVPGQLQFLATSDSTTPGEVAFGACSLWLSSSLGEIYSLGTAVSDANGRASYSLPVPASAFFEGVTLGFQAIGINPAGGPAFGVLEFSDALRVRIGDSLPSCR